MDYFFAYGTLRQATATDIHQVLIRYGEYFSSGFLQGKLYEIDGYPGAVESTSPGDKVIGELYKIASAQVLPLLDEYEECSDRFPKPHEYIRKKVSIVLPDGANIRAWAYVYNRDVTNLIIINSGDYLSYPFCMKTI